MAVILSDKAMAFVNAWRVWDAACTRHSMAADVALKNGKQYYMPTFALKEETDALIDTKNELADELAISPVHLMRALLELRHDGVDHAKCVRLVIQYLEVMCDAS